MDDQTEDKKIADILSSMGVEKYDPLVVQALRECAHTFAGDLLCDAKDYATHRGQKDVDVSDVKLALKLTQSMNVAVTPLEQQINSTKDMINRIPLSRLVCQDTYGARYPKERFYNKPNIGSPGGTKVGGGETQERGELIPDPATGLLQRRYTLVPGSVAYPGTRQRAGSLTKAHPQQTPEQQQGHQTSIFEGAVTMAPPEAQREAMDVTEM